MNILFHGFQFVANGLGGKNKREKFFIHAGEAIGQKSKAYIILQTDSPQFMNFPEIDARRNFFKARRV